MVKLFSILAIAVILIVGLTFADITVTYEPHNETEHGTLYGIDSENLHRIDSSQGHDEEEVETFYVGSGIHDGDERRGDIPVTHTHSPIKEPEGPQTETVPTRHPQNCPPIEPAKQCTQCCQEPSYPSYPNYPTYIKYPSHPLFPSWGGNAPHAPVIEDETEYINGAGGDHQVIFVTQPQPQPNFPQFPDLAPLPMPEFPSHQPPKSHPSIIYIPYQPVNTGHIPIGPVEIPGSGFGINNINGGAGDNTIEVFNGDSPHRNHEQIWKHHQQQHQLWLQKQKQQQQNQLSHLIIGGGGIQYQNFGNVGSVGTINGGGQRPCDSKK